MSALEGSIFSRILCDIKRTFQNAALRRHSTFVTPYSQTSAQQRIMAGQDIAQAVSLLLRVCCLQHNDFKQLSVLIQTQEN